MSEPSATLLAAFVGVFGALAGLIVERLLRSFGRLWCEPSGWELRFTGPDPWGEEYGSADADPEQAQWVNYSVSLDLFNGKEVPMGLRDVFVLFTCDDGEVIGRPQEYEVRLMSTSLGPSPTPMSVGELSVINLPPRQWVSKELRGGFHVEEEEVVVRRLAGWRKAELGGQRQRRGLFKTKTYRKTIATRSRA